jgi:hypothetical protein
LSTLAQGAGQVVGGPVVVVGGREVVVGGRDVVVVGGRVVVVGGCEVVVVGGRVVVVGGTDCVPPLHATPLMVKDVGAAGGELLLLRVARKPGATVPPVPMFAFQVSFWTVTFDEPMLQRPFQPWVVVAPPGSVKEIVQLVHGSPVLVTFRVPWKPVFQEFTSWYWTLQDTAAKAGTVDTAARPPTATTPTATMAIFRLEKRLKPSLMPVSPTCVRVTRVSSGVAD